MILYFLAQLLKGFCDLECFIIFYLISLNILDLNIGGEGLNIIILRKFH